ncbi:hypothetical protein WJX79_010979 [Trebouxia sp. C0005]
MLVVAVCLTVVVASSALPAPRVLPGQTLHLDQAQLDLPNLFSVWAVQNNKNYSTEERASREQVFQTNLELIKKHNTEDHSYKLAVNEYADLTWEEFRETRLGLKAGHDGSFRQAPAEKPFLHADVEAPSSIDWRALGAVTPVKNQAMCGSCWAFSTTGSVEGINYIKTGQLTSLSEQELVDCDSSKDAGCGGGLMDYAFQYIMDNGGLDTEEDYPYWSFGLMCNHLREKRNVVSIDGYEDVPENDEAALMKAVSKQPVSVAICASGGLQFYSSGVVDGKCCTELDHGVLAVGYGVDEASGKDYWIVKNSWGAGWGEGGFFRMARNAADTQGMCGIAKAASYPIKNHDNPKHVPEVCGWWGLSECSNGQSCSCSFSPLGGMFEDYVCMSWGCE